MFNGSTPEWESIMNKRIIAAIGVAVPLSIGPALAADLAVRRAAPEAVYTPAPAFTWSGFYVGGNIGGAWSNLTGVDTTAAGGLLGAAGTSVTDNGSGFAGGLQAGYNWQFSNWVLGVQGDISWTGINATAASPVLGTTFVNYKSDWAASVTGRLGYAWGPTLLYGKGGAAWVHNKYAVTDATIPLNATASETRSGWTAGVGIEHMFWQKWSAFLEYDYMGFGTRSVTATDPVLGPGTADVKQNLQLLKVGVNYHF